MYCANYVGHFCTMHHTINLFICYNSPVVYPDLFYLIILSSMWSKVSFLWVFCKHFVLDLYGSRRYDQ